MIKISKIVSRNKVLFLILLVSAILRFSGIRYSYPPYHSDEGISYSQGIYIIKEKTLDARGYSLAYAYPSLVPIINALFFKYIFIPIEWADFWVNNFDKVIDGYIKIPLAKEDYGRIFQLEILGEREINALRWGRIVSALFGTGVVFLSYLLSKEIFNKKTGLIVAALVAVNYRQVLNSHINLPDIYNAFFLILSLIFSYRLTKKPNIRNYLLAGIFAGLSFSTKFHVYSFISLIFAHFLSIKKVSFKDFLKCFFGDKKIYISFLFAAIIIMVINPFHLLNIEETVTLLHYVSRKYRVGRMVLDIFSYSYLYHIGVGSVLSLLTLAGIVYGFVKEPKKTAFVFLVVFSFLFVITFYTGGGFYTRNFVTITPLILIFAGYVLSKLLNIKWKKFGVLFFVLILLISLRENLINSIVVAREYRHPWNFKVLSSWLSENIPAGAKMSAHSSVPLPVEDVERLPFDFHLLFSIEEFRKNGAEYAIVNLDWATNEFYWWMSRSIKDSLRFWNKPVDLLEQMYSAMAIRELSDFSVYSALNSWQAPDSNFIVAKVPNYKVLFEKLMVDYEFENAVAANWNSEPIYVGEWDGFLVKFEINAEEEKDGFVYASFYNNKEDINNIKKRVAVRLSSRNIKVNQWEEGELMGDIPKEAQYMVLGFGSYKKPSSVYLDEIRVYNANVEIDLGSVKIEKLELDENVLFPNSHGYL